jgi:hypothetical protein
MTIHIVRNNRNEEVAAYTDKQYAILVAEELKNARQEDYRVEELVCEIPPKENK